MAFRVVVVPAIISVLGAYAYVKQDSASPKLGLALSNQACLLFSTVGILGPLTIGEDG